MVEGLLEEIQFGLLLVCFQVLEIIGFRIYDRFLFFFFEMGEISSRVFVYFCIWKVCLCVISKQGVVKYEIGNVFYEFIGGVFFCGSNGLVGSVLVVGFMVGKRVFVVIIFFFFIKSGILKFYRFIGILFFNYKRSFLQVVNQVYSEIWDVLG